MSATPLWSRAFHRRGDKGAVLVVVLLVMMALLGLGLTGLYLTTGTIQMNANINMRNQALQVAEAGIQRAKEVLNRRGIPGWDPNISGLLSATTSPANQTLPTMTLPDAIPATTDDCLGGDNFQKGAVLRDEPGSVTGCASTSAYFNCALSAMTDPNDPNNPRSLGNYTVFVRQDQAECRLGGNLNICENGRGSSSSLSCVDGIGNAITSNGIVVVRSEGTAADNRTMVAIEVTMARNPNPSIMDTRLATVCPAGQAGCDDNASVQQGITVSGALAPPPPTPPTGGSTETGGASGSAGVSGSAGASAGGATSPLAGAVASGGESGGAGVGGGGAGSGGASSASSTVPGCTYDKCNVIAVIGHMGPWDWNALDCNNKLPTGTLMQTWLSKHTSNCTIKEFDIEDPASQINTDPEAAIAPFKIILLRDIRHTKAERRARMVKMCNNNWTDPYPGSTPGPFRNSLATALVEWVKDGGGLITTLGYENTAGETGPVNKVLKPMGIAYSELSSEVKLLPSGANFLTTGGGSFLTHPPIASVLNAGVNALQGTGVCGIVGWNGASEVPLYQSWSPYNRLTTGQYKEADDFSVFMKIVEGSPAKPHAVGVAMEFHSGRVIALGDEWITYDTDWTPDPSRGCSAVAKPSIPGWVSSSNSCTQSFWENILAWLTATCTL
jgi:hypothetical protein